MNDSAATKPNSGSVKISSLLGGCCCYEVTVSQSCLLGVGRVGRLGHNPSLPSYPELPSSLFCLIYRLCVDLFYLVIRGTACRVYSTCTLHYV